MMVPAFYSSIELRLRRTLVRHQPYWAIQHRQTSLGLKVAIACLSLLFFLAPLSGQETSPARYEIDAKREGVSPTDKDALPRSREFIRLDSTYYVGYMYEGIYKADRSSDVLGYSHAVAPLKKAFDLFNRDYGQNMRQLFTSTQTYMQHVNRYIDILEIARNLQECYSNLEQADSVMWVLDRIDRYQFLKEHLAVNTSRAWTVHRNRFYTSKKYAFLKNSVAENEQLALNYCYKALGKIAYNKPQNDLWYGAGQDESDKLGVYHYLALLHCYNKNYDSSEYYYQQLMEAGYISWNNYANMQHELANVQLASQYFERDKYKYQQKTLREPYYYLPMLDVYAGRTRQAIATSKEAIESAGSTPGFGWYNISLGRSYLYDGQLDSAAYALEKAANFNEIHIGTTLTQSQYNLSVNLLRLQLNEKQSALVKFQNRGWWYSPTDLYRLLQLTIERVLLQYVLINQLATNPERERIIYDLFCGESTTSFDEALFLLEDFTPDFFIKKYRNYQQHDPRNNVHRYFKLVEHTMQWQDGDESAALEGYETLIRETMLDTANEKLFLARLYEGLSRGYRHADNHEKYGLYTRALVQKYPQLLPFTGLKMQIHLTTSGIDDDRTKEVIESLKDCNIKWVEPAAATALANIRFEKKGDKYQATINMAAGGKPVVVDEKLVFKKVDGVGKELALRLFGKGGSLVYNKS